MNLENELEKILQLSNTIQEDLETFHTELLQRIYQEKPPLIVREYFHQIRLNEDYDKTYLKLRKVQQVLNSKFTQLYNQYEKEENETKLNKLKELLLGDTHHKNFKHRIELIQKQREPINLEYEGESCIECSSNKIEIEKEGIICKDCGAYYGKKITLDNQRFNTKEQYLKKTQNAPFTHIGGPRTLVGTRNEAYPHLLYKRLYFQNIPRGRIERNLATSKKYFKYFKNNHPSDVYETLKKMYFLLLKNDYNMYLGGVKRIILGCGFLAYEIQDRPKTLTNYVKELKENGWKIKKSDILKQKERIRKQNCLEQLCKNIKKIGNKKELFNKKFYNVPWNQIGTELKIPEQIILKTQKVYKKSWTTNLTQGPYHALLGGIIFLLLKDTENERNQSKIAKVLRIRGSTVYVWRNKITDDKRLYEYLQKIKNN